MIRLPQPQDISPLDLLPQRPPFVMIDRLTCCDEETASARFTVREDNLFIEKNALLASGLIENMAQTCAAHLGYRNLAGGLPVKIGYIGAVSRLRLSRAPKVGETIDTAIRIEEELLGTTLADVKACIGEETIATARMKIAVR